MPSKSGVQHSPYSSDSPFSHAQVSAVRRLNRSSRAGATRPQAENISELSKFSPFSPLKSLSITPLTGRTVGELSDADRVNTAEGDRPWDEYAITGAKKGEQIHVRLDSNDFDPFLQVLNATTGAVIASNDDEVGQNARITFKARAGVEYRLRVTSYNGAATGQYEIETQRFTPRNIRNFNYDYGHGLVNAADAVARAIGTKRFRTRSGGWSTQRWGQDLLNASTVWKKGYTGKGVTVAVIDTGIQLDHPEFKGNLWRNTAEIPGNGKDDDGNGFVDDVRGWNFADDNADLADSRDHGTHIAGIIAANKRKQMRGMAYDAKIMPIKVVGESGGSQEHVARGIRYAVKNGADVINISLGADPGSAIDSRLKRALRFAHRKGVAVVVASGNERQSLGATQPGEPAAYTAQKSLGVVVGAIDQTSSVTDFSNPTGNKRSPFVVAPGSNIFSLSSQDPSGYKWRRGTSMAAAYVSGIVALMRSANPTLSPRKIAQILTRTAKQDRVNEW